MHVPREQPFGDVAGTALPVGRSRWTGLGSVPTLLTNDAAHRTDDPPWSSDEVQVATAAFLARDNGHTLEAYRHDLRSYFRWAADHTSPCSTHMPPPQ